MTEITYRQAVPEDIDGICALEEVCFPEEPWSRQMFSEELENELALFIVAEEGEKLAGYIIAWIVPVIECQVGSIAVLPEYRRRGVARKLMDILAEACRDSAAYEMYLEVRVSNVPAINLYKSFGFKEDGLRRRYYQNGEDAYTMKCHLDTDF